MQQELHKLINTSQPQEFPVDSIIGKKITNGQTRYLVKWLGFQECENTWEPIEHLQGVLDLVEEFETNEQNKFNRDIQKKLDKWRESALYDDASSTTRLVNDRGDFAAIFEVDSVNQSLASNKFSMTPEKLTKGKILANTEKHSRSVPETPAGI